MYICVVLDLCRQEESYLHIILEMSKLKLMSTAVSSLAGAGKKGLAHMLCLLARVEPSHLSHTLTHSVSVCLAHWW